MLIKKEDVTSFVMWLTGHDKETVDKLFDDFNNSRERKESVPTVPLVLPITAETSCQNCKNEEWLNDKEGSYCNRFTTHLDIMFQDPNLDLSEIGCKQFEPK